jgi:uncharacterized lipoprotein YmbA
VTYILVPPAAEANNAELLLGRPVIDLQPVLVPDYLDTSDLLVRREANIVVASATGRWGERLSVGVNRALAQGLMRRLPDFAVTTSKSAERPRCAILVDIESFETYADRPVVLVARWSVMTGSTANTIAGERVSLAEPVPAANDSEIVAAMSRAVEHLADRIAAGIRGVGRTCSDGPRKRGR